MRYDWLLEPISENEPCGPDLDELGNEKYLNYVLPVASRIPERYYKAGTDEPVERNAIKLKEELAAIADLLRETRDIRLLCIEARFQSFAGDFAGFSDCVVAIAGLVDRFWSDVHPRSQEGDFTLRQNLLSGLDDWWQIIQPLQHLPLVRDRRSDVINFRQFAIATGAAHKRPEEPVIEVSEIHRALSAPENREASDLSFNAVSSAAAALSSIRNSFIANAGYDYVPSFDKLADFLGKVIELFQTARPELASAGEAEVQPPGTGVEDDKTAPPGAAADSPALAAPKGLITNQGEAAAALLAIEVYFATHEPSSPALVLVHQARSLVGKPLVQAIEALVPEAAARAVIKFRSGIDFQITMPLMKALTENVIIHNDGPPTIGSDAANGYKAHSRGEALELMAEVESFFKTAEPSSPVPLLLDKAHGFTNRNFDMILKDLIGPVA